MDEAEITEKQTIVNKQNELRKANKREDEAATIKRINSNKQTS